MSNQSDNFGYLETAIYSWSSNDNISPISGSDPIIELGNEEDITSQIGENKKSDSHCNNIVNSDIKRKRQRDIKNQHEKKRRDRCYELTEKLRSLFSDDQNTSTPKLTRELILECAISEIENLRRELSETKQLLAEANAKLNPSQVTRTTNKNWVESSLSDPMNRSSFPIEELERVFQNTYARETVRFFDVNEKRTQKSILETAKMLQTIADQIGKLHYQLSAGNFELLYHCCIKSNPSEVRRCLKKNWELYQTGSGSKAVQDRFVLLLNGDAGAFTLLLMSIFEYLSGNFEASERTFGFAKQLCKKFPQAGANHFMLASMAWNFRGMSSIPQARRIKQLLQKNFIWAPMGSVIEGRALIANGFNKEGLEAVEKGFALLTERLGDAADVFLAPVLLDAYIQTRNVDKGLAMANYLYNKCNVLNIEAMTGKAALLRKKANLLILKKYPDFVPEVARFNLSDPSPIQDLLNLPELPSSSTIQVEDELLLPEEVGNFDPLASLMVRTAGAVSECDDIEVLLTSAMHLSHSRELHTPELFCGIDLARYYVHRGENQKAMEVAQLLKDSYAKMKGSEESRELKRARMVISSIEDSNFIAQLL